MIGRDPFSILVGYSTPTAALYDLTVSQGPYKWFGFVIGPFFFGIMHKRLRK